MNAILSIKPQFVDEIIAGRKGYEFRKKGFKQEVNTIFVYASSPVCRIVGEFELGNVLEGAPEQIWALTSKRAGVTKSFYDKYFMRHEVGYALEIKSFKRYDAPIDPYTSIKGFHAPQSFCYTDAVAKG
jgi:predicted transcriptional regulator